jgi:transposase
VLLFCDAAHPLFNNLNGYKWQLRGRINTQFALSNEGRKRLTILSAFNANTFDHTTLFTEENCDRQMIGIFLEELKKDYPQAAKIHVVLDNAAYHRAKDVTALAERRNIVLHFLPPYCPNLNLIERLWRLLKKEVLENNYFPLKTLWIEACQNFFLNWQNLMPKLKTLLSFKFDII